MSQRSTEAVMIVGSPVSFPDIRYHSGFDAPDAVVFLRKNKRNTLVVSDLEYGRAKKGKGCEVFTPGLLGIEGAKRSDFKAWAAALLKKKKIRRVRVPGDFPLAVAEMLRRNQIAVETAQGALFPERAIKSAQEIEKIRAVQKAAVAAVKAAIEAIGNARIASSRELCHGKRPLRSEDIKRLIRRELLEHDCEMANPIVAGGSQGADPHDTGHGSLRAGEPIVIDVFPRSSETGYCGDITRTVCRGQAPEAVQAMFDAVKQAYEAAVGRARVGVKGSNVHQAAAMELSRCGFKTEIQRGVPVGFFHGTGHGVGLAVHEQPTLGRSEDRLRKGNVVTIEPGLYYPRWGGVRLEDTLVITAAGAEPLAPFKMNLEIGS